MDIECDKFGDRMLGIVRGRFGEFSAKEFSAGDFVAVEFGGNPDLSLENVEVIHLHRVSSSLNGIISLPTYKHEGYQPFAVVHSK